MDEDTLQTTVEQLLPCDVIREAVEALGVQERQRKRDVVALVYALVITGGTPFFGYQAKALDTYVRLGAPRVSRAAFNPWFTGPFDALFVHLGQRACAWAASRPVHLPGPLAGVTDWRAFDSTTVKLPGELREAFAGTGDCAALKVHEEYSLGVENIVDDSVSAAREHDSLHLVVDERRRGSGWSLTSGTPATTCSGPANATTSRSSSG